MISTIGQLLDAMNVERQIFDLGRQVQAISQTTFQNFEAQSMAYPSPHLGHAWLAIVFWANETPEQPVFWFVKLPLDEQGKLSQTERDRFLQQLLTGAGKNLQAAKQGAPFEEVLKDNPFLFTPTPEKQAYINARVRRQLNLESSQYTQAALDYLNGDLTQWQELPLQGLADIVCDRSDHETLLTSVIPHLPDQPLTLLCHLLENEPVNKSLTDAILKRLEKMLSSLTDLPQNITAIALLRGMSQSVELMDRQHALNLCLNSPLKSNPELLATVASRNHLDLLNEALCYDYLSALAEHGQPVFNKLMQELLFTPVLRSYLLNSIQQPQCPESVKDAFRNFATSVRGTLH